MFLVSKGKFLRKRVPGRVCMTNIFYCLGNLFLLSNKSCLVFGGIFSSFSGNLFGGGEFRGRLWVASAHADSRALWQLVNQWLLLHQSFSNFVSRLCLYFVFVCFVFSFCILYFHPVSPSWVSLRLITLYK